MWHEFASKHTRSAKNSVDFKSAVSFSSADIAEIKLPQKKVLIQYISQRYSKIRPRSENKAKGIVLDSSATLFREKHFNILC